ncbi:MAG: flagellar basal body protein FliL [Treponema sp.]|jgi:flagellar basal body-associated protein FliL|nr:flagellar basal body protein FliL [Treponema sp.]
MKREITPLSGKLLIVYRVFVALALALAVVLITGSLYALFRSPDSGPLFRIGSGKSTGGKHGGKNSATGSAAPLAMPNVFSGIGRLRVPLAGEPAAAVILSISFPYSAEDRPFAEELASRIGDFRSIAAEYFASLPREKTVNLDEEAAKAGILGRYNAMLRLGRIETLYFGDLMIVE